MHLKKSESTISPDTPIKIDNMRYFTYVDFEMGPVTVSEEEIKKDYWDYWYYTMCQRYDRALVDEEYTFENCIDDWKSIHFAQELKS